MIGLFMGQLFRSVNISLIVLKKLWYSNDLGWFDDIFHDLGRFFATRIRIRFIEADPADQIETDPDPQHCI